MEPGYLRLAQSGELQRRIDQAAKMLKCCTICPHNCRIDRTAGETGICRVGSLAPVASYGAHFGEEAPLVGRHGSGTIFFASCNLLCIFCQNDDISHFGEDQALRLHSDELAAVMVDLQQQGCHNINLVTPSHVVPQILRALPAAIAQGLCVPLVYNSSGYDSLDTLALLDGVIDIYLPDFKFWKKSSARAYTKAPDYPEVARRAIRAMFDQVGDLEVDGEGLAVRGLIVRHLVMPAHVDETGAIVEFIANHISPRCHVNIMEQYRPCGQAAPPIDRSLSAEEYRQAVRYADATGLIQLNKNQMAELLRRLGLG